MNKNSSPVLPLLIFLIYNFFIINSIQAQDEVSRSITIRNINISGNNITKPSIIIRELPFKKGDRISSKEYAEKINAAKENVFNTRLFNFVTIDSSSAPGKQNLTDINIRVVERWYIWPWPYFEMSDRNFNAWAETWDFSRLTYGIDFTFQNVRGRNETIKIPVHLGFNQKYGFVYQIPYLNKKKTLGLETGGGFDANHEVVATSLDNKPVYVKDPDNYILKEGSVFAGLILRNGIYNRHTFRFSWQWYDFEDTLTKIPYYCNGMDKTNFLAFYYQFKNDHRDVQYYPLKGYYFDFEFTKYGFFQDVDEMIIKSNIRKYWRLHNRWYFATGITFKASLTGATNYYFLEKGLGYGRDFVRGYEHYVIDGQQYFLLKNNLKFAIIPQRVFTFDFMKSKKFNTVPYALYMNVFADFGYVNNRLEYMRNRNNMENSILVGYGAGFDFTTYYDIAIRTEVSLNGKGEAGVYLHFMAPI